MSTNHPAAPSPVDKAHAFRALHAHGVLVLPNAWDVASAVVIGAAGAAAVATTSAGASWSLGARDGEHLGRDRAVDLVRRIAGAVPVPVSADIEAGYAAEPDDVETTVRAVLDAGAVGVNLEDSNPGHGTLRDVEEQADRLHAARAAADAAGVDLFLNARTDVYLQGFGDAAGLFEETLNRGQAYVDAGADGLFVPGLTDLTVLRRLVPSVAVPLNVMVAPGAPPVAELARVGVRRVSVGMSLAQAIYGLTQRAAHELLTAGTYGGLEGGLDYRALNEALPDHRGC